eukprot:TRINITY_DN905_c0_g1_i2.p1 TRINITY_DN905_c0_g1~~TRINITY_DN905_c0_g1_i2.p1  ORF type:complete len:403 (+),score=136.77 TRINITY_DN905_c0_g1_i2:525-1733(+)
MKSFGKFRVRKSPIIASVNPLTQKPSFVDLASECEKGLFDHSPVHCEDGINGTLFLKGREGDGYLAVLKPNDGENEPENDKSSDSSHGISSEEASIRELAAYQLDCKNFYGVPSTGLVEICYSGFQDGEIVSSSPVVVRRKYGSLQRFKKNHGSAEDIGISVFPVKEIHKIAILDVQILNADRHDGNILFERLPNGGFQLIPIDHGFSLPHKLDKCWFGWLTWPQVKLPFSTEEIDHIRSIDVERDAQILKDLGISTDCIRNMRLSVHLLKRGAELGLTLYDIGAIICRVNGTLYLSDLENIIERAEEETGITFSTCEDVNEKKIFKLAFQFIEEKIERVLEKKKKQGISLSKSSRNLLRNNPFVKENMEPCMVALSPRLNKMRCNPRSPLASPISTRRLCL